MRLFLLILSIIFCFTINATSCHTAFANTSSIQINNFNYIDNFFKVDNAFYRGAQPDTEDILSLSKLGVKTIINLRDNTDLKEKKLINQLGMNFVNIPMKPSVPPTTEQINSFFNIISNPNNLPVYVHCQYGKDRTGIMSALYRVKMYRWDFNKTYSEMRNLGYHRFFFPKQKKFLANYINSLNIKTY